MMPLKEWLSSPEIVALKKQSEGTLYTRSFFRDPQRPIYIDPSVFYAPADGVVLYAHDSVEPDEPIVEIKGRAFTPRDALDDQDFDKTCLVVGIFMTKLDVHINRVPTSGYLNEVHATSFLFTPNVSMKLEEEEIFDDGHIDVSDMGYLFPNERKVVRVYSPRIKSSYFLVQIAERDVDEILNWGDNHFTQGDRYGMIRFGSQVDLILPLDDRNRYELLTEPQMHVQAGVDPIIEILNGKSVPES